MVKVRVTYAKSKEAMYLSHLDMLSVFERAFRRAELPLEYSKGFSPKPELVFASPLSVGIESTGEIFEAELSESIDKAYIIKELNNKLPKSVTVLSCEYIDVSEKNIMSRVYASRYIIELTYTKDIFLKRTIKEIEDIKKWYKVRMEEYLCQKEIIVVKSKKNGMLEKIDIVPYIRNYDFLLDGKLEITVDTGSKNNLRPELIMQGYMTFIDENIGYNIRREQILFI